MTLKQLKDRLKVILSGQKNIWKDESYVADIINDAVLRVCDKCIPVALLTNNPSLSSYRLLEGGYFIRRPNNITLDIAVVDIDNELVQAVIYSIASEFAVEASFRAEYQHKFQIEIDRYNYRNYQATESLFEYREIYESLLAQFMHNTGNGVYEVHQTLTGYEYRFSLTAVLMIDQFFLMGNDDGMSSSILKYVNEFALFQDGEENQDREDLRALDALFVEAVEGKTYEELCV